MTGLKFPDVLGLHVTPVAIASQCARFVATLSVVGALTQIHPNTSGSVDDAPLRALTYVHFHSAYGFYTQTLA